VCQRYYILSEREKLEKNVKESLTILNQPTYEFVICTITNNIGAIWALFVFAQ